jgi:hypothetical protein
VKSEELIVSIVVIMGIISIGATVLVTFLCCFHMSLCFQRKTTKEKLKKLEFREVSREL